MSILDKSIKEEAFKLRKEGKTYSDILKTIKVSKSTLSLWLRECNLSNIQKQRLSEKKLQAIRRGGVAKRNQRIEKEKSIKKEAHGDIEQILKNPLWLSGIMLYWAEGSKSKAHSPSIGLEFMNSDPRMIYLFINWCKKILKVKEKDFVFGIYIHENTRKSQKKVVEYWSQQTGFLASSFNYVYLKKHKIKTLRKNIGEDYYGTLKVRIRRSTDLNRKVSGWVEAVCRKYCRIV